MASVEFHATGPVVGREFLFKDVFNVGGALGKLLDVRMFMYASNALELGASGSIDLSGTPYLSIRANVLFLNFGITISRFIDWGAFDELYAQQNVVPESTDSIPATPAVEASATPKRKRAAKKAA